LAVAIGASGAEEPEGRGEESSESIAGEHLDVDRRRGREGVR
jgi:hypothetical protein